MADSETFPPTDPAGGSPSGSPGEWESLRLPDRYVVEAEIGRGGMGTVLKAHDRKHGRNVAIKVLRREVAHSFGADRFLREIRTAAQLNHPRIVAVFDSGEVDGTLYYVMPYVDGESLRQRMERAGALDIKEAVRITRDVAEALQYAHNAGIVHRDIKPENILLSKDGNVWLVDFGVAYALAAANPRLTTSGVILGTALYASPEQLTQQVVDRRSDLYSLGCVFYEMVAGQPPFSGTFGSVIIQHQVDRAKPLGSMRNGVSPALETFAQKAMEKAPEDRFQDATSMEAALASASTEIAGTSWGWLPRGKWARALLALIAVGTAAGSIVMAISALGPVKPENNTGSSSDSTRYLVLPFTVDPGTPLLSAEDRLSDALSAWHGIEVIDHRGVSSKASSDEGASARRNLLKQLRVGRFVEGRVSRQGNLLRLYAEVRDGQYPDVRLAKATVLAPAAVDQIAAYFSQLADSLLLQGSAPECLGQTPGTRSLFAFRDCDAGFSALEDGDVQRAAEHFAAATSIDAKYGRAALWLALTGSWLSSSEIDAKSLTMAVRDSARLTARERALTRGLVDIANTKYASACAVYDSLTRVDPADYAAWLGLGECHRRDEVVVPAASSPTRWAFRSSHHQAIRAYRRAFETKPALVGSFLQNSFVTVTDIFLTTPASVRWGHSTADTTNRFIASASWQGDTLALFPMPLAEFALVKAGTVPQTLGSAAQHQRDLLRDLAQKWAESIPPSAARDEASALALELAGDAKAVSALRRARAQAATADERVRLAAAEVWVTLKFALPDHTAEISSARALADSLLSLQSFSPRQSLLLAPLAIVLGRPVLAAEHARRAVPVTVEARFYDTGIVTPARALMMFAYAGAPIDSIRELERLTVNAIDNAVLPAQRANARAELLTQAAMLAFPSFRMSILDELAQTGIYTEAESAFARGDTAHVQKTLERLNVRPGVYRPADVTIDAAYIEAWLWNALGQTNTAVERLDASLSGLQWSAPGQLQVSARAGALVRAMVLRADIASSTDPAEAARWARAVDLLWAEAEASMQPVASRMKRIAEVTRR